MQISLPALQEQVRRGIKEKKKQIPLRALRASNAVVTANAWWLDSDFIFSCTKFHSDQIPLDRASIYVKLIWNYCEKLVRVFKHKDWWVSRRFIMNILACEKRDWGPISLRLKRKRHMGWRDLEVGQRRSIKVYTRRMQLVFLMATHSET